jgi:hypothetical protein
MSSPQQNVKEQGTEQDEKPELFKNTHAREMKYWQFIDLVVPSGKSTDLSSKDAKEMYCHKCNIKMKFVAGSSKEVSRHMKKFHAADLKGFQLSQEAQQLLKKRKFENFFAQKKPEVLKDASNADNESFLAIVASWCWGSYRPFSVVEDDGFRQLIGHVNAMSSKVKIPGRTAVALKTEECAATLRVHLKKVMREEVDFYCATTDIWTSCATDAFLSFTVHYLTQECEMKNWVLEVKPFGGRHTGKRLCDELLKILSEWELDKSRMTFLLRDNASNGIAACDLMRVKSMGCIPHSMHLVLAPLLYPKQNIVKAKKANNEILDPLVREEVAEEFVMSLNPTERELCRLISLKVKALRGLAKYFHASPKAKDRLSAMQIQRGIAKPLRVLLDVKTRWNSTLDMLQRILRLQQDIEAFVAYICTLSGRQEFPDWKLELPTTESWYYAECLCALLEPFKLVTEILSGEQYATLPLALPSLRIVKNRLSRTDILEQVDKKFTQVMHTFDHSAAEKTMESVRQYLLHQFVNRFQALPFALVAASVLHPSLSKMSHLTIHEKKQVQEHLIREMIESSPKEKTPQPKKIAAEGGSKMLGAKGLCYDALFADESGCDSDNSVDNDKEIAQLKIRCIDEFRSYIALSKSFAEASDANKCPLGWWKANRHAFPLLFPVARKWLGTLCSSVPSERAFSTSGNVLTKRRGSLLPETVRDLVFLHENS